METTKSKIYLPSKSQIRVEWEDYSDNFTQERQKRIAKYFSEKYSVDNVQVIFKAKKVNIHGVEIESSITDNIMDIEYQRRLFKEWLSNNSIKVDWDKLLRLDEKVNERLSEERETDYRYKNWVIREIEWHNFLSYGEDNKIVYDGLNGITVVTSEPQNQGGKSSAMQDLLLFLFFNTTTKGTTAIKMFNKFTDKDEVRVKGRITIDGDDYIIERVVTRKRKKSNEDYSVKTDLFFYKILPDGTQQNLEGEQRRETEDFIKKSIGSMEDFLLTIVADANNLENLIHTKPTEKGKILSRFIGLEVLEEKENIVKEMKSKWSKNLKSDQYNIIELENGIEGFKDSIVNNEKLIELNENEINDINVEINKSVEKKESLLTKKIEIDKDIINLRPLDIDREITNITEKGVKKRKEYEEAKLKLEDLIEITYDENEHSHYIKTERESILKKSEKEAEIRRINKLIKDLKEGEFCPVCKRALDDVDHTSEIETNENSIVEIENNIKELVIEINDLNGKVVYYDDLKKKASDYDRTLLTVDKLDLDLSRLKMELKEQKELRKKYDDNLENIEVNKKLDSDILGYSSKIHNLNMEKETKIKLSEKLRNEITGFNTSIDRNNEYIKTIKAEEDIKIIFDLYIRMIGKNGISKIIMKKIIPLINSELEHLLGETADFLLTIDINDKNEVEFLLEKLIDDGSENGSIVSYPINEGSGFEKTVSALALRCVMSKVSCLPKPNLIVLDEVLGKVANENLELISIFFNKAKEMFPNIFLITHNPIVKDWSNKIITVVKKNNISSLSLN